MSRHLSRFDPPATRRTILKASAATGLFATVPWNARRVGAVTLASTALEKYVDAMPVPAVRQPDGRSQGTDYYEIPIVETTQKLHRDLPPTTVWAYDGVYPGNTIEVNRDRPVKVKWLNEIESTSSRADPSKHLLTVDKSIHGAGPVDGVPTPEVRTVTHVHGLHVESASDGLPEAWFTHDFEETGDYWRKEVYDYANHQPGATVWYHDHALGITRLNVYAGLAGFYLIRDDYERRLNLPSGDYDVPIVLQDRTFNADGSLYYPAEIQPEFFGDTAVVNGKVWPHFEVEPRRYRFRFLNGCNSRFLDLRLFEVDPDEDNAEIPDTDVPPMHQIATDLGFLDETNHIGSGRLFMTPAERAEVIIDFTEFEGQSFVLGDNDAAAPYKGPGVDAGQEVELFDFLRFDVTEPLQGTDRSSIPERPGRPDPLGPPQVVRDMTLVENEDGQGRILPLLNDMLWDDPITELPKLGTTEVWNLYNLTEDTHPIHVHLVEMEVVDRFDFADEAYESAGGIGPLPAYLTESDSDTGPEFGERGRKDTVAAHPGQMTQIKMRFGNYAGRFVWHCHILEHEDHEMMRPFEVVTGGPTDGSSA